MNDFETKKTETVTAASDKRENSVPARIYLLWQVAAAGFGLLTCWMFRFLLNGDTFAQLEMANSVARSDWAIVPNGHWSPFFPFILGFFLKWIRPDFYWEYPVYHAVCGLLYLVLLAAFHFFLTQLIKHHEWEKNGAAISSNFIPKWVWCVLAYPAFIFMSVVWILTYHSGSDLAAALFVFWMAGLLLRIDREGFSLGNSLALGGAIGLGFLAKAVFVYVGGFFLAACLFRWIRRRGTWIFLFGAAMVALVIAAPWVSWLSHSKGRFTLSDVGAETYINSTLGAVLPTFGAGETIDRALLKHPPRKLMSHPDVYEFATPIRATYPLWYDSSYWMEGGIRPQFSIRAQISMIIIWGTYTVYLLFAKEFPGVILIFIIGSLGMILKRAWWKAFKNTWFLVLPSLGVVLLYAAVHSQARYLVPFLLIIWACFWRVFFENGTEENRRLGQVLAASAALVLILNTVFVLANESRKVQEPWATGGTYWNATGRLGQLFEGSSSKFNHVFFQIAQSAASLGLQEGDRLALVGAMPNAPIWAHLAGANIVAEIPSRSIEEFNSLPQDRREELWRTFRELHVRAVVTVQAALPRGQNGTGWQQVGASQYWIYFLPLER